MFLIDDLLLFPIRSVIWLARKVEEMTWQELAEEEQAITRRLQELYRMLDAGGIDDETFDAEEARLLDRLDEVQKMLAS